MKILLSFNEAYAPHAATVITGLIRHSSQQLSVAVLYQDIKPETIKKFEEYYASRLSSIEFIKVNLNPDLENRLRQIKSPMNHQGNIETWFRLFASSYIKDDYVVWLDCDIVVTGDICRMLDEVDNRYLVSGCKEYDPLYKYKDWGNQDKWTRCKDWEGALITEAYFYRFYRHHDISFIVPYLCSGIMYLNLKKWREERFEEKLVKKIYEEDFFRALDQDVLNSVLKGQFGVISPKWNTFCGGFLSNYDSFQLEEAHKSPYIVHLVGNAKPWNEQIGGIYRETYWEYRLDTPWPLKPNLKFRLKKIKIINDITKIKYWLKMLFLNKNVQSTMIRTYLDDIISTTV